MDEPMKDGVERGTGKANWREVGDNQKDAVKETAAGSHRNKEQGAFGNEEAQEAQESGSRSMREPKGDKETNK